MTSEHKVDEQSVTVVSDAIIEAYHNHTEFSHNATDDNPPSDDEVHAIANAIVEAYNISSQNTSMNITNLNITDNSVANCNNCTFCTPDREWSWKDTPWYWYVVIGLLLIIVTLGVALATWIFLDERKTRTVAKKRAERRASLGGTLDR